MAMYCNDEKLGENMLEVGRLLEASVHCDSVNPWDQVSGTAPNWQPGIMCYAFRELIK